MKFRRSAQFAVLLVLGLLLSFPSFAQFRSGIEGTVTDSTGAVVPDAKVTLSNMDTGISKSVQSNGEGLFRFPSLPPGRNTCVHRSEEHTSELQSRQYLVCRLLLEKKKAESDQTAAVS